MRRSSILVPLLALVTLTAGLVNLFSLHAPPLPERLTRLEPDVPLGFVDVSHYAALLSGFVLVIASVPILRRKRRALWLVLGLALVTIAIHLAHGPRWGPVLSSLALAAALLASRRHFTVGSGPPDWGAITTRIGLGFMAALAYGVAGFWLLDRRDFGIEFHLLDALRQTLRVLAVVLETGLSPHTRHARWFLDSLETLTLAAFGYAGVSLFRPAVYRLRVVPRQREAARRILAAHGRCALDAFKVWPDKSLFFDPSRRAFLAYRVAAGAAVVLGDPVGPADRLRPIVMEFLDFSDAQDWDVVFHQTLPDWLSLYEEMGYRKLKIGDEAIVDLPAFTIEGGRRKDVRNALRRLERQGFATRRYEPPLEDDVLDALEAVSDSWLTLPGRRERRFSLGRFERGYVRETPVMAAVDPHGRPLAFVNVVPSCRPGEATIDLMRHRSDAPNGVVDFLLVRHLLACREAGFQRFDLGLAPLAGFGPGESPSGEERAIHAVLGRLDFLFSFQGLRRYKAKFASTWEPRFLVFGRRIDLPRLAIALRRVSEIPE